MKKVIAILLFAFAFTFTLSAQRTVSGVISDDTGLPLIGANVLVDGSDVGTITDIDGSFSLDIPEGVNEIIVSYTGYDTQSIDITGISNVVATLSEGRLLDEIVVTAGGLEKNKARLGYAIQNVDPDEVTSAREVNLVDALNSKVAGVSVVSSSGSPGASSNIRIRGSKSINGSNDPLFVVDGIPIDNSSIGNGTDGVDQSNRAIDLNPNDIASLTVLKGPAATALYGVRAANGAIVVTTKKGEAGKSKVSISTSYSVDQVNKLPARQSTYAQGRVLGGTPTYQGPATGNGFSWGPEISSLKLADRAAWEAANPGSTYSEYGQVVASDSEIAGSPLAAYDAYDFFIKGNTYDLNASVSGGSDVARYFISAGRLSSTGVVPNSTFGRTTFRVNTEANITDRLSGGMSASFSSTGGSRIQRGSNLNGVMLGLMRTAPTFDNGNGLIGQAAADNVDTYTLSNGDQRSYRNGIYDNPYWTVNKNPFNDNVNRIIGNLTLGYDLMDNLKLNYRLGVDSYADQRNSAFDIQTNPNRPVAGTVEQTKITNKDISSNLFLSFNRAINDKIGFSGLVGTDLWDKNYNRQTTTGTTMSIPGFYHISNTTNLVAEEIVERRRIIGAYVTADFSFEDFLFLNLTGRNDWSSTLPSDNNNYASYSASLGFAFTEALDLRSDILDYGKLRLSYGKVGLDAQAYQTKAVFIPAESGGDGFISTVQFPAFGTNSFERDAVLANPFLTPESTNTYEIGGEFKLFNGRLGADITYYNAKSQDVIIDVDISAVTGYENATLNSAIITNKGWEVVLNGTPVSNNNFSWDIGVNFTKANNDVVSLAEGLENVFLAGFTSTSAALIPNNPYSVIFGNGFQRNDDGDMIIGADGWPLQDPTSKVLGDPNPDWTAGIRNTLTFGDITLSALLDVRQGGEMWCGTCGIIDYFGTSQLSADERNDVVVFEGVVAEGDGFVANNTPVALAQADPSASFSSFYRVRYGFGGITEMNIHDTSWIRLRDVTLGYTLPGSIAGGLFDNANISLSGRNLWLKTEYPGIDPETNLTGDSNGYGLDYFNMPNTKSITASLKLNF